MKKILVISHNALSVHGNNGKTLAAIFGDWPPDCLAQIFFNNEIPESSRFQRFYRVSDSYVLCRVFGISRFRRSGGVVFPTPSSSRSLATRPPPGRIADFFKKHESAKLFVRDVIFGTGAWFSPSLKRWIKDFSPDSIFFLGGNSVFAFRVAQRLSRALSVPLDVYLTDDYVINAAPRGIADLFLSRRLNEIYGEILREARHVFVIGDEMSWAFNRMFGRECVPLMNTVVLPPSLQRSNFGLRKRGSVDFVYAGGMHLGRHSSLLAFGAYLKAISSTIGIPARLTVFSVQEPSEELQREFQDVGVIYGGALNAGELEKRLKIADFVLHVESFDPRYIRKTKLSVSTKIPEYLASEVCTVAFGPSEVASIKLIADNRLGLAVTECDSEEQVLSMIARAILSEDVRRTFIERGFAFAKANFDASIVRNRAELLLN